jgi:fructokinase
VKLNDTEGHAVEDLLGKPARSVEEFCTNNGKAYGWEAVCVTRGARGCALWIGGEYMDIAGYPVKVVATVGSGDAFAAAFVHGLSNGWPPAEIGDFANRLGALVASRPGAIPAWIIEECRALDKPAACSASLRTPDQPSAGGKCSSVASAYFVLSKITNVLS